MANQGPTERYDDVVYHLMPEGDLHPGATPPYEPESLAGEGFIHMASWRQLPGVASRHFGGQGGLIAIEIDTTALPTPPVWEDLYDLGERYPHLYAAIPGDAITGVLELLWLDTGAPWFRRRGLPREVTPAHVSWKRVEVGSGWEPFLARLNSQLIEDEGHDTTMQRKELLDRMHRLLRSGHTAYLLEAGDLTAGYALVEPGKSPVHIRHYFVQRGLRREGIGSLGFTALLGTLGFPPVSVDVLMTNEPAMRFWRAVGFADRSITMRRYAPDSPAETRVNAQSTLHCERMAGDTRRAAGFLKERLRSFNDEISRYHRQARSDGAIEEIAAMLVDETGTWRGGVCGSVYWAWLAIDDLWVAPELRGRGYGTRLLSEIETMAMTRGAVRVRLSTYSFQARAFYERYGYRVVGELKDHPPGESFFWMRKDLSPPELTP